MEHDKFGALKRVDVRTLWPHEALDFTPWLARNLGALAEVLGMDLELTAQESDVGPGFVVVNRVSESVIPPYGRGPGLRLAFDVSDLPECRGTLRGFMRF